MFFQSILSFSSPRKCADRMSANGDRASRVPGHGHGHAKDLVIASQTIGGRNVGREDSQGNNTSVCVCINNWEHAPQSVTCESIDTFTFSTAAALSIRPALGVSPGPRCSGPLHLLLLSTGDPDRPRGRANQSTRERRECQMESQTKSNARRQSFHRDGKMRTHVTLFKCPLPRSLPNYLHKGPFHPMGEVSANLVFLRRNSMVPNAWASESGQLEP